MRNKTAKILSSFALAAMLTCTGAAAQAAEVADAEYIGAADICDTANWNIEDYANNVKDVYIMNYPEAADTIAEIVDSYLNDNEFAALYDEMGGSAFLIVEEAIHNALTPDAAPTVYESDGYFSRYSIPTIKQKSGYSDGAAAAVLMALYGCGYCNFPADVSSNDIKQNILISEITWNSNKQTTIGEVTRTLRRYYSGTNGLTFQTKYTSNFNEMIRMLTSSLEKDAAPVLRIPDGNSYYYGVVSSIYDNDELEEVTIIDPREGTSRSYTLDEFKTMLFPNSQSFVWMSVYDRDNSNTAIEKVKSEYPSYFTQTKGECKDHNVNHPENSTTCKDFDGGWQCAGFARYVFYQVKGRLYSSSIDKANVTGFGERTNPNYLDWDNSFSGKDLNEQTAKQYLQGLPTGTYVRVETPRTSKYYWHSFAVLDTSDTGITIYQANYGGKCLVKISEYTWSKFAQAFPRILFYVD